MPRREEPFGQIVTVMRRMRAEASRALLHGQWTTEAEGKELVGKVVVLDELLEDARTISGPGTNFGEEEL